ncbi:hypothetical protein [Rhizobium phage RHph_X3_2]|nr:hypothetical protein [Rhizobium phage RHph_X3_2]
MQANVANPQRINALHKTVSKLSQDIKRLDESKTAAAMQRAMTKVATDFKLVKAIVDEVLMNNEAPHDNAEADHEKSTVEHPVQFVHKFLDKNPTLSRKAAIDKLRAKGVNISTARTQYHKWKNAHA